MRIACTSRRLAGLPHVVAKYLYRRLIGGIPEDPVRAWPGTEREGQRVLRLLHVGDCGVRRMDTAHDLLAPLGYPAAAARALLCDGIGIDFSHHFCVNFEELPNIEQLRSHIHLGGDPDILLVQIGSAYTRKVILPDRRRVHQLRDELGRRTGRFVLSFYRVLRPCLRVFGRHSTTYRGIGRLQRFVQSVQREWPSVEVVLVVPFRRSPGYRSGECVATRIESDLRSLAEVLDVFVFDANDLLGRDPTLRCVTGYNLNGHASELVGIRLAEMIRSLPLTQVGAAAPTPHRYVSSARASADLTG